MSTETQRNSVLDKMSALAPAITLRLVVSRSAQLAEEAIRLIRSAFYYASYRFGWLKKFYYFYFSHTTRCFVL